MTLLTINTARKKNNLPRVLWSYYKELTDSQKQALLKSSKK